MFNRIGPPRLNETPRAMLAFTKWYQRSDPYYWYHVAKKAQELGDLKTAQEATTIYNRMVKYPAVQNQIF